MNLEVIVFGAIVFTICILSKVSKLSSKQETKQKNRNADWIDELIVYDCIFEDED